MLILTLRDGPYFSLNLGLTCDFFYQYHVVKVIFWGYRARASRRSEVSYFSLSKHLFLGCSKGPAAMAGDAHVTWRGHTEENCDSLMDSFSWAQPTAQVNVQSCKWAILDVPAQLSLQMFAAPAKYDMYQKDHPAESRWLSSWNH